MKTLFLIFNHTLTQKQKTDAQVSLGIANFKALPQTLLNAWANVDPKGELNLEAFDKIVFWLSENSSRNDFVLVQGDFGATFYLVDYCFKKGLIPIYATTLRATTEYIDGREQVKKISQFEHVSFRKYRKYK